LKVNRVEAALVRVPLPQELRLGPMRITTRDYVALRVHTDAGLHGDALGYPRGTPLLESVARVARHLPGHDPLMRRQPLHAFEQGNVTSLAGYGRALSLVDIALWDICCKVAGLPLYQMLGGLRSRVPVTAVAGYYMDCRPLSEIADEVAQRLDEGFARVKVMLKGDDPDFDLRYVRAVTSRAPGRVAADAHWSWTTLTDALRVCRQLDDAGLAFLEDPFPPHAIELTTALAARLRTPLAAGEDVPGARAMLQLASHVAVLRVDATTCGGITGALAALHAAGLSGCNVLPHVFAPLHVHLACAFGHVEAVEWIPEASGADPLETLLLRPPRPKDGQLIPDPHPGVGLELDWTRVMARSERMEVIDANA
jgi:L-alanine-DL-glutamate epimerase-like enolase superfamily enzyme